MLQKTVFNKRPNYKRSNHSNDLKYKRLNLRKDLTLQKT